jgi:protoporphyrinogen oxidase
MERVRHLVVGAGISGLSTAAFLRDPEVLVLEADREIGGWCKTVKKDGFVWDYSGHFFHFKHREIEHWLRARMPDQRILDVEKKSFISYKGKWIDFPFQKNIHQLPTDEFIDCLHDLYFASVEKQAGRAAHEGSFKDMLYARFGKSIAEKFLIPYNEKLYACDLATLDRDAMGRFFPHADLTDIIRNMKVADNATYNAHFTYPEGGAIEYVNAIASEVPKGRIVLEESLLHIDLTRRIARTNKREIQFERLVSSMPFPTLLRLASVRHDEQIFTWNKVLVFNLGFDRKGPKNVHWAYYPDRARSFYRLGFYDNIFDTDRLSLYVELGYPRDAEVSPEKMLPRVLDDLRAEGVIDQHQLVASHHVWSIGRYGAWTYCSIEDNIVEARQLCEDFGVEGAGPR